MKQIEEDDGGDPELAAKSSTRLLLGLALGLVGLELGLVLALCGDGLLLPLPLVLRRQLLPLDA